MSAAPTLPGRGHGQFLRGLLALLLAPGLASVAVAMEPLPFESPEQEARFRALAAELRCVMCQNQSLADSNAGIASDLRREVFGLMQEGKSDTEIKAFLTERYGEFVLYQPPVAPRTWLLWFGPLLVLLAGATTVVVIVRRRRPASELPPPAEGEDW